MTRKEAREQAIKKRFEEIARQLKAKEQRTGITEVTRVHHYLAEVAAQERRDRLAAAEEANRGPEYIPTRMRVFRSAAAGGPSELRL